MRQIRIGTAEVAIAVRLLSYSPDTSAMLPLLITQANDSGDLKPIAAQALLVQSALASGMAGGMHNAVVCTEDAPFYDSMDIDLAALSRTYLGTTQFDLLKTMCAIWPRGLLDDDLRMPLESQVPTLLLSGGDDPITPPDYAIQAAATLGNAALQTNPGQGHGQVVVPCMGGVIADFFLAGSPAELETNCAQTHAPAPFFLSFSGPEP
jgi:pimeloyl-ACP methyl ester carboxylesterase